LSISIEKYLRLVKKCIKTEHFKSFNADIPRFHIIESFTKAMPDEYFEDTMIGSGSKTK